MNVTIVGYGEIGKAFEEVLKPTAEVSIYDKMDWEINGTNNNVDVLIIAFPYDEFFKSEVWKYKNHFNPKKTVIVSTVPIGTCRELEAIHSPVEGKHPRLADSIRKGTRWVGGSNAFNVTQLFEEANLEVRQVKESEFTEFLKLRSTSLYGVNIEFARYSKSVANKIDMDFELVKEFDRDYNNLYKELGMSQFQRYILDPPEGKIGGHCVVPNAEILDKQYPHNYLKDIYDPKI